MIEKKKRKRYSSAQSDTSPNINFITFVLMKWREHIVSDKGVLIGKPTIKGTRISVEFVIGLLAQGGQKTK